MNMGNGKKVVASEPGFRLIATTCEKGKNGDAKNHVLVVVLNYRKYKIPLDQGTFEFINQNFMNTNLLIKAGEYDDR